MSVKTKVYDAGDALNPAASVFVSANAGAGKTSLLTNRVLSLLLHGAAPSKILCLTFTNAAAAEMTSRIQSELGKWVMMKDAPLRDALAALMGGSVSEALMKHARSLFANVLEAPEGIRIQTIHGFCQSLLRRFPIEAGISPHFTVMDSRTEEELLQEARQRLFSRAQREDPRLQEAIHAIARNMGESGFHLLVSEIIANKRRFLSLLSDRKCLDQIQDTLRRVCGIPKNTTIDSLIAEYFLFNVQEKTTLRIVCAQLFASEKSTDQSMAKALMAMLERQDIDAYTGWLLTANGERRKIIFTKNAFGDPAYEELLKQQQERAWEFFQARNGLHIVQSTFHLMVFAEGLLALYAQLKEAYALMDYDDLILSSCRLLQSSGNAPWVLYKLDGGIDHLLVDEAQDTSPEQWAIISSLTQEFFAGIGRDITNRSLFIVGDEKQSIYSFQGADPQALGKMQLFFADKIRDAGLPLHRIDLQYSFRSTPEVLKAVDAVFANPKARAGLMFSDAQLRHIPTRTGYKGVVELWPLVKPLEEEGRIELSATTLLARHIASNIQRWLKEGSAGAGDIMILVRSRTALVDKIVRALKKADIPVAGHDRMALSDNLAVQDLLALGQCVLLPEDDLSLAALLKSPIFNLTEEQLFTLSYGRGRQALWERLRELSPKSDIYKQAYDLLVDIRSRADFISPYALFSYVLDTLEGRKKIIGRMGAEYNDPIDEFLGQALLFETSHTSSLQGFMHWIAASDSEIKRDMEQVTNAVRIMTVHGSKGLQAPIVILPDTAERPKPRNTLQWYHAEIPLWGMTKDTDTKLTASIRGQEYEAMMSEYRRLLYVALTRAQDRLYVCGATSKEEVGEDCWYQWVHDGLEPIAETIELPWGKGLRVGQEVHTASSKTAKSASIAAVADAWDFLQKPVAKEPAIPKPLTPSRLVGGEPAAASPLTDNHAFQRGTLIHKLLQHLPEIERSQRQQAATRMASSFGKHMPESEIEQCIAEILSVLQDESFGFVFGSDSLAEVPVAGCVQVGDKTVSVAGQIDRLCVSDKAIWIIDFKSNRYPPAKDAPIAPAYLSQMQLYRLLLQQIYPQKKVHCALLWTAVPAITVIAESLLDETPIATYI